MAYSKEELSAALEAHQRVSDIDAAILWLMDPERGADPSKVGEKVRVNLGRVPSGEVATGRLGEILIGAVIDELLTVREGIVSLQGDLVAFPLAPLARRASGATEVEPAMDGAG